MSKFRMAPPPKAVTIPSIYTPNKSYSSSMAIIAPEIAKAIVPMILKPPKPSLSPLLSINKLFKVKRLFYVTESMNLIAKIGH